MQRGRPRCRDAGIPDAVGFRSKWRIALDQLIRFDSNGVRFDWLVFDEAYGNTVPLLWVLGQIGQRFVAEVPVNCRVRTSDAAAVAHRAEERQPGTHWPLAPVPSGAPEAGGPVVASQGRSRGGRPRLAHAGHGGERTPPSGFVGRTSVWCSSATTCSRHQLGSLRGEPDMARDDSEHDGDAVGSAEPAIAVGRCGLVRAMRAGAEEVLSRGWA